MKRLIVYFSRSGHNKKIAEDLSKMLAADIEEIVDKKPKGFMMSGYQSMNKKITEIAKVKYRPSDYEQIIVVAPMWFGGIPPALRTYAEKFLSNINIALASVSGNGFKNKHLVNDFARDFNLKISPLVMISDTDLVKNNYQEALEQFVKECMAK